MSRQFTSTERTAVLYNRRNYSASSEYNHDYIGSDLIQGMLTQIGEEDTPASEEIAQQIMAGLDQIDGGVTREEILSQFPGERDAADRALSRLKYYRLILEGEQQGKTIIGLHPGEKEAARKGYEADRTRKAALRTE
ncbi:hypothetical protein C435_03503 [Haloarcula marismortui ATCC 33799]|uniref:Uncharacterized protein n=2 Tax=Haloarcula marismortui TaxID=2238 RepID=M0KSR9_9EURY|nr:hypothetical protein C435_03503 [Haloarcula californiae ATCC 33799]